MNHINLIGRLTKDAEMRTSESGKTITRFNLAVKRNFTNANGEFDADFISCVAFDKRGENIAKYTHKGSQLGIDGRLQTSSVEKQDGTKQYFTDVIVNEFYLLDKKEDNQQNNEHLTSSQIVEKAMKDEPSNFEDVSNDDDIFGLTDDDSLPF